MPSPTPLKLHPGESMLKLSGLLSRKKSIPVPMATSGGGGGSRRARGGTGSNMEDFKIERTDLTPPGSEGSLSGRQAMTLSSSPSTGTMAAEPPDPKKILEAKIAQKTEEQEGLRKLLQFYTKCSDAEGIAEAMESIARNDKEIAELRADDGSGAAKPSGAQRRRQHARNRSLSTSALPNIVRADQQALHKAPMGKPKQSPKVVHHSSSSSPDIGAKTEQKDSNLYVALYKFQGANDSELSIEAGDEIIVKSENADWYLGVLAGGKQGWFPKNYCRKL